MAENEPTTEELVRSVQELAAVTGSDELYRAAGRLKSLQATVDRLPKEVLKERERQDAKWGEQNHPPEWWLVILGEEYGESCKASLHGQGLREELVQTAAVAIAAIESLDRNAANDNASKQGANDGESTDD